MENPQESSENDPISAELESILVLMRDASLKVAMLGENAKIRFYVPPISEMSFNFAVYDLKTKSKKVETRGNALLNHIFYNTRLISPREEFCMCMVAPRKYVLSLKNDITYAVNEKLLYIYCDFTPGFETTRVIDSPQSLIHEGCRIRHFIFG